MALLALVLAGCGGGRNARSGPISVGPSQDTLPESSVPAPDVKSAGESGAGFGGGSPPPGTLGGLPPGEAGPLQPQSLYDFTQTQINPWGPVAETLEIELQGGGTMTVNRLVSVDPFTSTYQLENGNIFITNADLSQGAQYSGVSPKRGGVCEGR